MSGVDVITVWRPISFGVIEDNAPNVAAQCEQHRVCDQQGFEV